MHLIYLLSVEGYCTSVGFMGLMEAPRNPSRNRRDQAGSPSCMKPAMEKGVVSWPASITASSFSKFLEDVWWWLLHGFFEKLVSCEGFGEFWCRKCNWHNTDKHRRLNTPWLQRCHKSHLQARNTWLLRVLWCLDVTLKPALICFMCTFSFCLNWGVSCLSARNRAQVSRNSSRTPSRRTHVTLEGVMTVPWAELCEVERWEEWYDWSWSVHSDSAFAVRYNHSNWTDVKCR